MLIALMHALRGHYVQMFINARPLRALGGKIFTDTLLNGDTCKNFLLSR